MKTIYKKIIAVLTIASFAASCSDDFLVENNPNDLSTDSFWLNLQHFESGLNAVYNEFSNASNVSLVENTIRTDLAWGNGFQRPNTTNAYYLQSFTDAEQMVNRKWATNYTTIFRANQLIANAPNIEEGLDQDGKEELNLMVAQARFIRGYMYFLLHTMYNKGAVPIKDVIPVNTEDFNTPISSSEKVREYYLEDLEFAKENLPNSWDDNNTGRVTAGAAVALMGQSALYAGEYETASEYFKDVIDNYGYSLTDDIGSNFTTRDEFNEESILEVAYSLDFKTNLGPWDGRDVANTSYVKQFAGSGGWRGLIPANWLIIEYKNEALDSLDQRNWVDRVADDGSLGGDGNFDTDDNGKNILRSYSLRTSQSVALVDDLDTEYYGEPTAGHAINFNVNMTAYWRKHTNWDLGLASENEVSPGKVRSGVNERLIRLAEIYLQYAECQIELGNVDEALLYINKLRRRSGVVMLGSPVEFLDFTYDNVVYDANSLKDHLRFKEYPLELAAEGDGNRNIDLHRWGVKSERFKTLSEIEYSAAHQEVSFENENDASIITRVMRWSSVLYKVDPSNPAPANVHNTNFDEFKIAADNYNDDRAYLPIPSEEILTNPNIFDNGVDGLEESSFDDETVE
ncbi:RagB/SusD family nutrient uptake outer membrane protein [Wenyingzhuangia sp. IMCC45574]